MYIGQIVSVPAFCRWLLALVLVVSSLVGCDRISTPRLSPEAELAKIERRWNDGIQLAATTPKIALSSPVGNLQAIRRDLEDLTVNECLRDAKTLLIEHMNLAIEGFFAFMRDEKYLTDSKQKGAEEKAITYRTARAKCPG